MIAARQEVDLRPQLERLDRLLTRSAGVDAGALTFAFRPLWQLSAAEAANVALVKAQATQVYAGLKLWPDATMATLVEAQLAEDGTYPGTAAVFSGAGAVEATAADLRATDNAAAIDFDPNQARDPQGRWTTGGGVSSSFANIPTGQRPGGTLKPRPSSKSGSFLGLFGALNPMGTASAQEIDPEEEGRRLGEEAADPTAELRIERYVNAKNALKAIDPNNQELFTLTAPNYVPSETDIQRTEAAVELAARSKEGEKADLVRPGPPALPTESPPPHVGSEAPASTRPEKALISHGPPGLAIKVTGANARERGDSYEQGIRIHFGFTKPAFSGTAGAPNPDGADGDQAFEVKYTDNFSSSIYAPESALRFSHNEVERMIDQARRYSKAFPKGVIFYTNDQGLATAYANLFKDNGIANCRFIIVPSTLE